MKCNSFLGLFLLASFIITNVEAINKEIEQELHDFYRERYEIKIERKLGDNFYLYFHVKKWLGTPFNLFSSNKKKGIGEVEFLGEIFDRAYCQRIQGTISEIQNLIQRRSQGEKFQQGDILFFAIHSKRTNHIGIYLKDDFFVHVTSLEGVIIDSLQDPSFKETLQFAGKIPCTRKLGEKNLEYFQSF
jgi:murein DD-endopeptidase / murein LD-carboxypeptidase